MLVEIERFVNWPRPRLLPAAGPAIVLARRLPGTLKTTRPGSSGRCAPGLGLVAGKGEGLCEEIGVG